MTDRPLVALQHDLYAALNAGDEQEISQFGLAIATRAVDDLPTFHAALNALGFHSRLAPLNEMMARAWPMLQKDPGYSRAAVEAYAARAADHLIYAFLEESPRATSASKNLVDRIELYFTVEGDRLNTYLSLLSGQKGRPWSMADFEPLQMSSLNGLAIEFLGYARQRGLPYSRAHLARELLPRYLLDRQDGNLQPKTDVASVLRQARPPFPVVPPEPLHSLAPDRPSLLLFLERLLQTAYPQTYGAAALLTLGPLWLEFLAFRRLISGDILQRSNTFFPTLLQNLTPLLKDHPDQAITALATQNSM